MKSNISANNIFCLFRTKNDPKTIQKLSKNYPKTIVITRSFWDLLYFVYEYIFCQGFKFGIA